MNRFLFNYAIPVIVFAYCYGHIFHTIRRQSKVVSSHAGPSQDVSSSRGRNAGQPQQQQATGGSSSTGATATGGGGKLSRTEMNVLKTMITIIACFIICGSASSIADFLQRSGVSIM